MNLAFPEPSSCQPELGVEKGTDLEGMGFDGRATEMGRIREEGASVRVSGSSSEGETGRSRMVDIDGNSVIDEARDICPEKSSDRNREDQAADYASTSPKRTKILKTRIDERGREGKEKPFSFRNIFTFLHLFGI